MNDIVKARKVMWKAFKEDPDFADSYKAQIACFIMDNFPGYKCGKNSYEKRNELADQLFDHLYNADK